VAGVESVRLEVARVDETAYRAVVTVGTITYPFRAVDVEVVLLVDGAEYARRGFTQEACGRPPDQPCYSTVEFDVVLEPGTHTLEARARHRDPETVYPDDFVASLRPRSVGWYYLYPLIYVRCSGSTATPQKVTSPDGFLSSVREWLWQYDWAHLKVLTWEEVPLEYPKGYKALRSVEWEGRFVYAVNLHKTTEDVESEVAAWMVSRWGLEDSTCYACVEDVVREVVG